jgi:hypothetical protein
MVDEGMAREKRRNGVGYHLGRDGDGMGRVQAKKSTSMTLPSNKIDWKK